MREHKDMVLVTGSSSGIGRATALKYLQNGYFVYGMDVNDATIFSEDYEHYQLDVTVDDLPTLGDINILINNAGVQEEDSGREIEVNLKGLIRVTERYGLSCRIKHIVNVASVSAHTGAEFPQYAASKGGVLAYTKAIANEIARYGATCNSISPGGVYTPLNKPVMDDKEKWEQIMDETLLKKWSTCEEIAEWVYFMTTVNTSMTGQDIIIDNGEMARSHFVW